MGEKAEEGFRVVPTRLDCRVLPKFHSALIRSQPLMTCVRSDAKEDFCLNFGYPASFNKDSGKIVFIKADSRSRLITKLRALLEMGICHSNT
ncbi:hypothetical protein CDAR_320281 [Caerostris darwini]|uniref:Uncharacterized protein n=1 Tax=Caerostris darwini TaxID=1538125 RepID=A0AAV4PJ29_9ARAC|nr:hypothetical protein CDAR_320281 [Caerostris darwini]